jgi:uncharacterized protein involved in response to NO
MAGLTKLEPEAKAAGQLAFWDLGFRPFYLMAGLLAAVSVPLWVAEFAGVLGHALQRSSLWHAHEMIFGFAFAVIVGFLFTAGRNWSGQPTPAGRHLAAIATLWLAGRLLVLTPWPLLAAVADTAFALAAALGLAVPLVAARNRRNYFFVALLLSLGAANLAFHLTMAGLVDLPLQFGLQLGLDLVLFAMVVMGGRVIPMFSNNGVPGCGARRVPWLERAAPGSVLVVLVVDAFAAAPAALLAAVCALSALLQAGRLALWQPWRTLRHPLVWVLHAAYTWIAIHLALRAGAALEYLPGSAATHALTVGAIGGMTLGMMTRTARGHSGLPLRSGATEAVAYVLLNLAALARIAIPSLWPAGYVPAVVASGALWALAFALFVWRYVPVLLRSR